MTHYEIKTEENITKIIFHDDRVIFLDIDSLFKETNIAFAKILQGMFIDVTFDFSKKYNRLIYCHAFLKTACEHISSQVLNYRLFFYSNMLTKDPFRNRLVKKIKRIFGFKIMEDVEDFSKFIERFENGNAEIVTKLQLFLIKDTKPKTFKHIKKYLEKEGLKDMGNYFQDVANKMSLMY